MKKITFIATAILFGSFSFQNSHAQNLRLGIKAGANIDRTSGDDLNNNFKGSFLGGVYGGVQFAKLRVQAELLYSQTTITTGNNFKDAFQSYLSTNATSIKNGTFKMNELSIPIVVGINLIPKLLWLELGPQYTAVVSVQDKNSFLSETGRVFKDGSISGFMGASMELPSNLNIGVRYVMGITDRNNSNVNDNWRTNMIQISVGYSFLK